MNYISLMIITLIGFSSTRINTAVFPTPQAHKIDTLNHTSMHRIYRFDGIVRKPWTFYNVVNGELKSLSDTEQIDDKTKHWNKFILSVRDITVDCVVNSAYVTILYNRGKFRYMFKRSAPNKYIFNIGTDNLILIIKSSLICEFYFIKGSEAVSVSNMDWEMAD